ncbi:MAG: DUF2085 domain-containing protein [Cyclonatronaceae bacterium]
MDSSNIKPKIAVFLGAIVTVIVASGPGLFGTADAPEWINSWQRILFEGTCHQLSERSFYLSDVPMAVCSRCYGFYWGLLAGLPLTVLVPVRFHLRKAAIVILALAAVIVAVDVIIDVAGLWQNTLTSRFITGLVLGSSLYAAIFFNRE